MKALPKLPTLITILLTAFTPVIWGTTYLVTTEFLPQDRPLITAVIRTLPAGLILILLTRSFVPTLPWPRLLLLSLVNIGAFQALLFVAAYRLPGGIAAVVGALQPLMVLGLAWGIDRKRPPTILIGTAMFGVTGMALLFASPGTHLDSLGITAALAGTACMAMGTFLSRRWRGDMPVLAFTGWQLSLGGLALVPLGYALEGPLPTLSLINWFAYAYLSIIGTLVAYSLWFSGIARLSPVAVSAMGLLSPVTALILGWYSLGEALGMRELAGILVVLASVCVLQLTNKIKPQPNCPLRNLENEKAQG